MDKSRSLGQKIGKVIGEGLLIILSLLLWLFILYAAFTIFGILFQSDNYYVLLGNSILKSSPGDIIDFFRSLLVLAFIVAIYLSITFRLALRKARCKEEGLPANEGVR